MVRRHINVSHSAGPLTGICRSQVDSIKMVNNNGQARRSLMLSSLLERVNCWRNSRSAYDIVICRRRIHCYSKMPGITCGRFHWKSPWCQLILRLKIWNLHPRLEGASGLTDRYLDWESGDISYVIFKAHFDRFVENSLWFCRTLITVTSQWARWHLKSPASWLFSQTFIQAHIKENIKAPRHWSLCGEFTGDRWIPRTKDQSRGKCYHLMTSSCVVY